MYIRNNPNPNGVYSDDCVVRAISIVTGKSWDAVYFNLCMQGYLMKNMPSANKVWGTYLKSIGYDRMPIASTCPDCYTVRDFSEENRYGKYILATGSHVVAVVDGNYCDAWDSGDEMPIEVWRKDIYGG